MQTLPPPPARLQATPITVGGRTFVPVEQTDLTFAHELYITAHCTAAGLAHLAHDLDPSRPLDEICHEIVSRLAASGRLFDVLAGAFVEQGRPWSEAAAAEAAQLFAGTRDPVAKRALWDQTAAVCLGFFVNAAASSRISLSSWSGRAPERAAAGDANDGTAAPATSETSAS